MSTTRTNFYVTGGTLQRDAPSYVHRQADEDLYAGLTAGRFCYVLTPRQMGKSSLMVRTAVRLRAEGVAVVVLDLTALGRNVTVEQWYFGIIEHVGKQLDLEDELEEFWRGHEPFGPLQRLTRALREVVLARVRGPLVVFVDEIDYVRSLPFSTDEFFAAIREFYNGRTEEPELQRLTVCLLGVATPSDLIRDTRTTPFNIGTRIELTDFSEAEAAPLARGLVRDEQAGARVLKRVLYWTGGHPYLTQRLCLAVAEDSGVTGAGGIDHKCRELFLSSRARERDDNLLFVRERILRSEEADRAGLLDLYQKIRSGRRVPDDETNVLVSVLRLSGVTRVVGGMLRVRNRIYHRAFDKAWVMANMPDAEAQRQRAAYRKGLQRAAALAAVIIILLSALTVIAIGQRNSARQQRSRADDAARKLEAALSVARTSEAKANRESDEKEKARRMALNETEKKENALKVAEEQARIAEEQKQQADEQRHLADSQREQAIRARARVAETDAKNRRLLYASQMTIAQQLWERGNISGLKNLLGKQIPKPGENEDPRAFEWYYLWRLAQTHRTIEGHSGHINSFDVSPDGRKIVTGSADNTARVWNVETGEEIFTLAGEGMGEDPKSHAEGVYCVAFSPDGKRIITGSLDKTAKVWDAETGKEILTLKGHEKTVTSVALSLDGLRAATGSEDKTAKVWDTKTGEVLLTLKGHEHSVVGIAISPDGKRVVTSSHDKTAKMWDAETGELKYTLGGHNYSALSVAFSPDGRRIVTADYEYAAKVWDAETGKGLFKLEGHNDMVNNVAYSQDGKHIVTNSEDMTTKVWDAETGKELLTFERNGAAVSFAFSKPDGSYTAVGFRDEMMELWNTASGRESLTLKGHEGSVFNVAFSPDGGRIATASSDDTAKIWDAATGEVLRTFTGHTESIMSVAFSPDGRRLVTGSEDKTAKVWDAMTGKVLLTFDKHSDGVWSVAFSPDGRHILTGSSDDTAKVWDAETGEVLHTLRGHDGTVLIAAFSRDGKYIVTGSSDNTAKVWDAATGKVLHTLAGHDDSVVGVAFSPDGRHILTGSSDKTAKVWDAKSGRVISLLEGYAGYVNRVTYSNDGRRILTSSSDNTAKIWDAVTEREMMTLKGHSSTVTSVAFSPDGRRVVTGSDDDTAKVWEVDVRGGNVPRTMH